MRTLGYALRQGWASVQRGRGSTAFAVGAIALAVLVLGAVLLLTWNAEQALGRWAEAAEFSVYLRDDATPEQLGLVEALIDASGVSAGRTYVSKAEALKRFRQEFADLAALADGFGENPFPASIEVQVSPGLSGDARVEALVADLAEQPGVVDVRYDRVWLDRVGSVLQAIRTAGFALSAVMAAAAAISVALVVRLGLHARRDEIEILALVGAPLAFIRGPFVAEGLLQGGAGSAVALLLLWLAYLTASRAWGGALGPLLGAELQFLPATLCAWLVAGGMLVGSAGGYIAARRIG